MDASRLECFKAYDIRGRVPEDLNLEIVRHIGLAFAEVVKPKKVCLGRDMRLSSRDIFLVLATALEDAGVDVVDLGLCGTEEVYFATASQGFDGGIMITASHNPANWNGMKIVGRDAKPVSSNTGLNDIKELVSKGEFELARTRGVRVQQTFRQEYIKHLLSYFGDLALEKLAPLKIVADAGNGCAYLVVKELAKYLPCTIIPMQEEPDGTFPNGVPNPLLPEKRRTTAVAVLEHRADFGLAWDGDFDRCFFFDEKGQFIEGYYIVGLLAQALLAENAGEKILYDARLVWNTQEMVAQAGGIGIETKAGHAFIKERMRAENAIYGGEMSAHHYFRDFAFCDSGMIVWLLIYKLLSQKKLPLSALVAERMEKFPASGEINRSVKEAPSIIKKIETAYTREAKAVRHVDGLSMEFEKWRFNLRSSNTEPLLRLNVESRGDAELMQAKTKELLAHIEECHNE